MFNKGRATLSDTELRGCSPKESHDGSVRAFCPFHGSDKQRSLKVSKGGSFYCFQCKAKGYMDWAYVDPFSFRVKAATKNIQKFKELLQKRELKEIQISDNFLKIHQYMDSDCYIGAICKKTVDYLEERNVSRDDIKKHDMRFSVEGKLSGRVIIPITMNHKAYGWVSRSVSNDPNIRKYLNLPGCPFSRLLFNVDKIPGSRIIICEGVFDAIAAGDDAVATFGKDVSKEQQEMILKFDERIVFFDYDARDTAIQLAKKINGKVAIIEEKNEDPSSLGNKRCREILHKAVSPFSPSLFLVGL